MNAYAIFGFVVGLFNVVEYFYNIPRWYKLGFSIFVSILTCLPAAISLLWAIRDLWSHPFSKVKFLAFGLAKYFLADAFQDVIDEVDRIEKVDDIRGRDDRITGKRRFRALFGYILYSDPLTRAYKRQYYSYAHWIDCSNVDLRGGTGDMYDGKVMQIEGAYENAISIRGHRLCVVHMSKIEPSDRQFFLRKWQEQLNQGSAIEDGQVAREFNYCLHLDVGSFEKHKILNDEAAQLVDTMISWWSANPEKPILTEFHKETMTAKCACLYVLYCAIDDDFLTRKKHDIINVGGYVQIA